MNATKNTCQGCYWYCYEGPGKGLCDRFRTFETQNGPIESNCWCAPVEPMPEMSPHEYELYCLDALPEDEDGNRVHPTWHTGGEIGCSKLGDTDIIPY